MSGRLAYALAVIIVASPIIIIPSLYFYNIHRQHQAQETVRMHMEAWRAKVAAEQLARQNH